MVLCSSGNIYGKQSAFVLHEELAPRPGTTDAAMALTIEHYGRVYREVHGVPTTCLRLFRTFGPDEEADRSDASVVARFIRAALDGTSPAIFGDGQQTRDLIYVDNVVSALQAAVTASPDTLQHRLGRSGAGQLPVDAGAGADRQAAPRHRAHLRPSAVVGAESTPARRSARPAGLGLGAVGAAARRPAAHGAAPPVPAQRRSQRLVRAAREAGHRAGPRRPRRRRAIEVSDADLVVEEKEVAEIEWAPVPAVPGFGR